MTLTASGLLADLQAKQDAQPASNDPKCSACGFTALHVTRNANGREIKRCVACGELVT